LPWDDGAAEDNVWFNDYSTNNFANYKFVIDNNYLLSGELMKIEWKLSPNENRVIAGFNCRKATGVIFDSVYIFAFYTDEIMISGGPMGINGLPGMILGLTIPRMYTSWIATKLQVNNVDTKKIVVPLKGKKKAATELEKDIKKAMAGRGGSWMVQELWNVFL
jgi:GLPGLI family protein